MSTLETHDFTSARIFQSSDLKKDRALLDAARNGFARLRDTDGTGLVMLPESGLKELTDESRHDRLLAEAASDVLRIVRLMSKLGEADHLDPVTLGRWNWLSRLDRDDLFEFVEELGTSIITRDVPALLDALMGWEETAAALADPDRMASLTREHDPAEYVEVARPEAESAVASAAA
jgi:hypothetical protein